MASSSVCQGITGRMGAKISSCITGEAGSTSTSTVAVSYTHLFTQFFGRGTEHYTTYLFCGNLVFSYFSEATSQGMASLMGNSSIFTKVNVPKYLFLFSKNVQTLINFGLTLCVFFVFCVLDGITFTWRFVLLLYPIGCLVLFNIGVGLILSAMFVFFRDIQYLWTVFTQLLMYMSAIFYTIDRYSYTAQCLSLIHILPAVLGGGKHFDLAAVLQISQDLALGVGPLPQVQGGVAGVHGPADGHGGNSHGAGDHQARKDTGGKGLIKVHVGVPSFLYWCSLLQAAGLLLGAQSPFQPHRRHRCV